MLDLITTPYSWTEAVGMIRRRFLPPPPRPRRPPIQDMILEPVPAVDIWIGFVGDISPLQGRTIRYDSTVESFLADCNRIVGNLEGVITDRSWFPYLHNHTLRTFEALEKLKPLDRWVLSIANNHALDYGRNAIRRTVNECSRRKIECIGTSERPRVGLRDGITVTSWTWWVNREGEGVVREDPGCASTQGLHVAYPHWGYEHERQPRPSQRQNLPEGYHAVIGHHSHLPQPLELVDDRRPVAWSLGNFITAKQLRVLGEGAVVKLGVTCRDDGPVISRVKLLDIEIERPVGANHCAIVPCWKT